MKKMIWATILASAAVAASPALGQQDPVRDQTAKEQTTPRESKPKDTSAAETDDEAVTEKRPQGRRPGALARLQAAGSRPQAGDEVDANPGRPFQQRDMSQVVELMIQQFDQDGDEKLDSQELKELLTALRERQGMGGLMQGANRPFRPGTDGQGTPNDKKPAGNQGKRQPSYGSDEPGGVTPNRPPVE